MQKVTHPFFIVENLRRLSLQLVFDFCCKIICVGVVKCMGTQLSNVAIKVSRYVTCSHIAILLAHTNLQAESSFLAALPSIGLFRVLVKFKVGFG